MPVLRDDEALEKLLTALEEIAARTAGGLQLKVVVVDGAADDSTRRLAAGRADYVVSPPSRGGQIATGIANTDADWVWILHADTGVGDEALAALQQVMQQNEACWGRFDIELPGLAVVAWFMNQRSRITRICTGDQGCFVARALLQQAGGFPDQPLMEDIEWSRRLKRIAPDRFVPLKARLCASSRRWQHHGALRTVVFMWMMRLNYFFGASAEHLYQRYYRK